MSQYVFSHWHGKQPIAQAFWINFFLIPFLWNFYHLLPPEYLIGLLNVNIGLPLGTAIIISGGGGVFHQLVFFILSIWGFVGVWRSSVNRRWVNLVIRIIVVLSTGWVIVDAGTTLTMLWVGYGWK
jgi:hypothetical protein